MDVGIQVEIRIPATSCPSHLRPQLQLLPPAVLVPPGSCHLPLPSLFPRTALYKYLHPQAGRNLSPAASLVSGRACSLPEQLPQIWLPLVRQGQALVWGLQSPWCGGRSWREKLRSKEVTGLWRRSVPSPPPAASVASLQEPLVPALAGVGGPASQRSSSPGWGLPQPGLEDHFRANWLVLGPKRNTAYL